MRRVTDHFSLTWNKPSGFGITEDRLVKYKVGEKEAWIETLKGKLERVEDPPDITSTETIPDEEVEQAVQAELPGNWLPKKRTKVNLEKDLTESEANVLINALSM